MGGLLGRSSLFGLLRRRFKPRQIATAIAGARGERIAARYLKQQGYRILDRNVWFKRLGEIDILALSPGGRFVVIVEVKTRATTEDASFRPEMNVHGRKIMQLSRMAQWVVKRRQLDHLPVRFDVVGVDLPARGKPVVRHHPHAFESTV